MPEKNTKIGPKRLVLLDLDGVLLDSRENMRLSWEAVRSELGIDVPFDRYFGEIGLPFREIMTRLGLSRQAAEAETAFRVASMKNIATATFFPDTEEALARLAGHGVKLGVVTSKDERRTNAMLGLLAINFANVQTPNDACRGKPAPDHLLMAMAQCGVDPAETIYVGDMRADAEAARRAGVDYAHAAWGYGDEPEGCRIVLRNIAEMAKVLAPSAGNHATQ